jgi:hypothetical protein
MDSNKEEWVGGLNNTRLAIYAARSEEYLPKLIHLLLIWDKAERRGETTVCATYTKPHFLRKNHSPLTRATKRRKSVQVSQ